MIMTLFKEYQGGYKERRVFLSLTNGGKMTIIKEIMRMILIIIMRIALYAKKRVFFKIGCGAIYGRKKS